MCLCLTYSMLVVLQEAMGEVSPVYPVVRPELCRTGAFVCSLLLFSHCLTQVLIGLGGMALVRHGSDWG